MNEAARMRSAEKQNFFKRKRAEMMKDEAEESSEEPVEVEELHRGQRVIVKHRGETKLEVEFREGGSCMTVDIKGRSNLNVSIVQQRWEDVEEDESNEGG